MSETSEYRIPFGDDELKVTTEQITSKHCSIHITSHEAVLLRLLYAAERACVPHETICEAINQVRPNHTPTNQPSYFVTKLKNKLNSATAGAVRIKNVHGQGYRLLY